MTDPTKLVVTVTPEESPILELTRKGGMHHIAVVGPSRWPHGILSMGSGGPATSIQPCSGV